MQTKIIQFLKPNIWKIILFIISGIPPVLGLSLSAHTLDRMPEISVLIMKLSGVWIFFCIMINSIFSIVGIIINIIVLWLIACLVYFIWKKLSKTKRIILVATLAIILCGFLVYDLSTSAIIFNKITFEKNSRVTISSNEVYHNGYHILEYLKVKNNSFVKVKYTLPTVTACLYDSRNGKFGSNYYTSYSDTEFYKSDDTMTQLKISPGKEINFTLRGDNYSQNSNFDTILVFYGLGNDDPKICSPGINTNLADWIKIENN